MDAGESWVCVTMIVTMLGIINEALISPSMLIDPIVTKIRSWIGANRRFIENKINREMISTMSAIRKFHSYVEGYPLCNAYR